MIFYPAEYVNGAMHMDTVEITISPVTTGRRKEGKVVSVIERGMKQVVCTYEASDNFGFAVRQYQIWHRYFHTKGTLKGCYVGP